ncbi:hypothetical protein [Flavobacterium sp. H122]|uniref:hypothetical protein n=1 Tax=Flavobacterium sp. H122 TaxID=2529860 RepID=UPI0010AA0186|nr:hypothetical protein [Flavobacterium sp. H122]
MFSEGQLLFAVLFFIAFVAVMIFSYRKDIKLHKQYYKGSLWILIAFFIFIGLLFVIKSLLKAKV